MDVKKKLIIFLIICLPITWILMGIAVALGGNHVMNLPGTAVLYMTACFMPSIAAVICCVITGEPIRSLNFLPKFQGNGMTYAGAVLAALMISIFDTPFVIVLFFPSVGTLNPEMTVFTIIFQLLLYIAIGCVQFYLLMGEEIGWMGYLYPKLEKLYGTNAAIVMTGLIRSLWHIVILAQNEKFAENFALLCFTNITGGCLLVLLTKKSGSVVPAAVCHSLMNTLPEVIHTFIIWDEVNYEKYDILISVLSYIPYVIIMGICWYVLMKKYKIQCNRSL